jgi:hypothetical protein
MSSLPEPLLRFRKELEAAIRRDLDAQATARSNGWGARVLRAVGRRPGRATLGLAAVAVAAAAALFVSSPSLRAPRRGGRLLRHGPLAGGGRAGCSAPRRPPSGRWREPRRPRDPEQRRTQRRDRHDRRRLGPPKAEAPGHGQSRPRRQLHVQREDRRVVPSKGGCCSRTGAVGLPTALSARWLCEPDRERVHGVQQARPEAVAGVARIGGQSGGLDSAAAFATFSAPRQTG